MELEFCFFFQAEDGIRDLVRSRGLGDVYKRQLYDDDHMLNMSDIKRKNIPGGKVINKVSIDGRYAVSYTHLTLPTSDLV